MPTFLPLLPREPLVVEVVEEEEEASLSATRKTPEDDRASVAVAMAPATAPTAMWVVIDTEYPPLPAAPTNDK
jgi:hypothetical protein